VLQLRDVLLSRQRDADPVELFELTVLSPSLFLELGHLLLECDVLHRHPQELAQRSRGGVRRRRDRDVVQPCWRLPIRTDHEQGGAHDLRRVDQGLGFEA